ncbi:signal peptidase I [Bifidobacterium xylocopae]|uniref:Signal peptidase I n=1 Tax=Bifidobacterium xylocopae TaxID=2493119 RepID=A0A366KBX8_9BIFI|nr:signal peptidase I [Bifidobacterium xylocopae]RBP99230.1 signal peptidase I [Bifidobacterium xylocopae]
MDRRGDGRIRRARPAGPAPPPQLPVLAPRSGDDVRKAFELHPRHASRLVLPDSIRHELGEVVRKLLLACLLPILLVLGTRIFLLGQYSIPSGSMENTLAVSDRVITTQNLTLNRGGLRRGDIIVFRDPAGWLGSEGAGPDSRDDFLIKRLIGLPGDRVACEGGGHPITVNGSPIDESSYLKPGAEPSAFAFDVAVPAGHLFVLGDNRANSADSRYHRGDGADGMVPVANVTGVAVFTCWPVGHVRRLDDGHGPFASVPDIGSGDGPSGRVFGGER